MLGQLVTLRQKNSVSSHPLMAPIVMVNFTCRLELRDAQITGKTLFLGVSGREFLEEIRV